MPQLELLEKIVKLLSQNSIKYMLTGSIVSSHALNVFEIQFGNIDMEYLTYWAQKLDVLFLLDKIKSEAEI